MPVIPCPETFLFPLTHRSMYIIFACDQQGCIGAANTIPFDCPEDLKYFGVTTSKAPTETMNAVVMGRKTYESIPAKFRPLRNRLNIVLSAQKPESIGSSSNLLVMSTSLLGVLKRLVTDSAFLPGGSIGPIARVWICGGAALYKEALSDPCRPFLAGVFRTRVDVTVPNGDTYVSSDDILQKHFVLHRTWSQQSTGKASLNMHFEQWYAHNKDEQQYLDLCQRVISEGQRRDDRTGTGTLSCFGAQMRFSLRNGRLPLLTTKRVFWKGVCEELLWFIRGSSNAKTLADRAVRIWDGNSTREFLDSRGLSHYEAGDLGPVYGFQWRHFGADYKSFHDSYEGQGVDQLSEIVRLIKEDPFSRRIVLSAWNPTALPKMALPPCHILAQFYVGTDRTLSCQLYQRSCDLGLGVPFNIASYALFTILLAKITGLEPGEFIHTLGDAHVYSNHIEALQKQLERTPRPFPFIKFKRVPPCLEDFQLEDFIILDYDPMPMIKMAMAV